MKHVKSLAGQTAVYGISSILGRVFNYLLVPLHTALFLPDALGIRDYLYVASALLLIVYTHGMETTYFRFSTRENGNEKEAFNKSMTSVILISTLVSILIIFNSQRLANLAEFPSYAHLITWIAIILFIDAVTAIPFAQLRLQNKAKKFAVLKVFMIMLNILFQLIFLLLLPSVLKAIPADSWLAYFAQPLIDHIFLANLLANLIIMLFFINVFIRFRPNFSYKVFKPYLLYSLPLLLTGVAGWVVEQSDKFLVKELMTTEDLGVYAQTFKLAIFMQLAVQAFRYAGEPFFFNQSTDKNAPGMFADILYYFTVFGLGIFVLVGVNVDLIGYIFLRNPAYRVALTLVPVLLMAKLFYGIYINISIWFKLKDKTIYGTYFTLVGAAVTLLGNFLLIPVMGYQAAAMTMLLAYFLMSALCYLVGRKHLKVPYRWGPIFLHIITASAFTYLAMNFSVQDHLLNYAVHLLLSLGYVLTLFLYERYKWKAKSA